MSSSPLALGARRVRPGRPGLYLGVGLLCALIVAIGFSPSYYLRPWSNLPPLPGRLQLHGLAFSAWIVLFVVQGTLARQQRLRLHRTLGMAATGLAGAMVYLGASVAISQTAVLYAAGRNAIGFPPLQFLALQLGILLQFVVFVILGVALRRHPEAHKRLLLLATLSIISPAIGRMPLPPLVKFLLPGLIVLGCIGWDLLKRRRVHPAFLWGGVGFLAAVPLRIVIGGSAPWTALARWMVS